MIVNVNITNKIARAEKHEPLVCGNSDYFIEFTFDDEWNAHHTKTARFIFGDRGYEDVVFNGSRCAVPVLQNTNEVLVGVYAGDLKTTTPAYLRAKRSILCGSGLPVDPTPDVYAQIMALLDELEQSGVSDEQIAQAIADYLAENPIEGVSVEDVQKAVDAALQAAKDSGEFDGAQGVGVTGAEIIDNNLCMHYSDGRSQVLGNVRGPQGPQGPRGEPGETVVGSNGKDGKNGLDGADGKSAYQYAQEGGYTGTEAEFAAKMAEETPNLSDYYTKSETDAAIDAVANGEEWELIETITIEESNIASIVRKKTAYSAVMVSMKTLPDGTRARGTFLEAVTNKSQSLVGGASYIHASEVYSSLIKMIKNNGLWDITSSGQVWGWGGGSTVGANNPSEIKTTNNDEYISSIRLYVTNDGCYPIGTIIKIYGVKADA